MGGSGGGRGMSSDEIKRYEETAKEIIRGKGSTEKRNVFISFDGDDMNDVNLLRGQAKNENTNLDFSDYSLKEPFDSKNAEYIKRGIREKIKQTSVTICYITEKTASSKWVNWEIRESIKLGKGVIGVYKGDTPPSKMPAAVTENRIEVIPWNHKTIKQALDRADKKREKK